MWSNLKDECAGIGCAAESKDYEKREGECGKPTDRMLQEVDCVSGSPVLSSAATRRNEKKLRCEQDVVVAARKKLFTFCHPPIASPPQHCILASNFSTISPKRIDELNERTNLMREENVRLCGNRARRFKTPFRTRRKRKHFLYPYRDVVDRPERTLRAGDLMTIALDTEMLSHDFHVISKPTKNTEKLATRGLIAFSDLRTKTRKCEQDDHVGTRNKHHASPSPVSQSVAYDGWNFLNCSSDPRTIRLVRILLNNNDDALVIRRLRQIGSQSESVARVHDFLRCAYSIYFFAKYVHLGSLSDLAYRRSAVARLIYSAEQMFPRTRFSCEFVNAAFHHLVRRMYSLNETSVPINSVHNANYECDFRDRPYTLEVRTAAFPFISSDETMTINTNGGSKISSKHTTRDAIESADCSKIFELCQDVSVAFSCGFLTAGGRNLTVKRETGFLMKRKYRDIFAEDDEECTYDKYFDSRSRNSTNAYGAVNRGLRRLYERDDANDDSRSGSAACCLNHGSDRVAPRSSFASTLPKKPRYDVDSEAKGSPAPMIIAVTAAATVISDMCGFRTGTGKLINTSVELLKASRKKLLDDTAGDLSFFTAGALNSRHAIAIESKISSEQRHGGFQTGAGRLIPVRTDSTDASKKKFWEPNNACKIFDDYVDQQSTLFAIETIDKLSTVVGTPANIEISTALPQPDEIRKPTSELNPKTESFDLSEEITESTRAFLYDVSNGEAFSFVPCADHDSSDSELVNDQPQSIVTGSPSNSPVFGGSFRSNGKCPKKTKPTVKRRFVLDLSKSATVMCTTGGTCPPIEPSETFNRLFEMKEIESAHPTYAETQIPDNSSTATVTVTNDVTLHQQRAAIRQQHYVNHKPAQFCKPFVGHYYARVTNDTSLARLSLRELARRRQNPKIYSTDEYSKFGLVPTVLQITSQTACNFTFTGEFISEHLSKSNEVSILFGDAAAVLSNKRNEITLNEIRRAFLAGPGVDPKLVSYEWIANHYRWIVWKLASTERSFPQLFGGRYLTVDNVLFQLRFRYDREIDNCVRPALKRILESDDSPARPLILCVAAITKKMTQQSLEQYDIELTDGWYSIFGEIDDRMNKLISRRKVVVGTKLIIVGAELLGCAQGCDPLHVNNSTRLKFSTNACRRARWYARLGFHHVDSGPISRISTLFPNGGFISHLSAMVARVYPLLFLEKNSDLSSARVHNEKSENKRIIEYEKDRLACVETIMSQVTNQIFHENYSMSCRDTDSNNYNFEDAENLRGVIQERIQSLLPEKFSKARNVSRLLKLRLVDSSVEGVASAVLTIWNPSDDVVDFFKEEKTYNFYNTYANGVRSGDLQLSSKRSSRYDKCPSTKKLSSSSRFSRRVTFVGDLNVDDRRSVFDEVDMAGIIVKTCRYEDRRILYLSDLQQNFFAISFRTDEKNFDYGDVIKRGKIVAGVNLHWKKGFLFWNIPILFASEYSLFVQSTRFQSLQRCIDELRCHFTKNNVEQFIDECERKLNNIGHFPNAFATIPAPMLDDSSCLNASALSTGTVSAGPNSSHLSNIASDNFTRMNDPNKKATLFKIENLKNYGEPPPLSPVTLTSRLKTTNKLQTQKRQISFQ